MTPPCLIMFAPLSGNLSESDCACENFSTAISAIDPSESDCACAPAAAPNLQSAICNPQSAGLWGLAPALYRAPLPGGYQIAFSPTGPAGVVVLNGPAAQTLDSFAAPAPLADPTARQLAALGLLAPAPSPSCTLASLPSCTLASLPSCTLASLPSCNLDFTAKRSLYRRDRRVRRAILKKISALSAFSAMSFCSGFNLAFLQSCNLTVWLHLTTRCNLRCAYCYAPRGQTDMPPEIGRAAVDGAIRSARAHGFQALKLKYAGGEPTLNLPTLRAVHRYARARAPEAGLDLREVLLTNGTTLTPGLLQWLRDEGIRLAISLDGLGPAHDGQRTDEGGAGSFTRVAEGIEQAQASGLTPHLSVTVTAHNVDGLAEVVAFALDRGLPFNLNFVRPAPGRPDLTPDPERLIAGLQAALSEMEYRLQSATSNLQSAIRNPPSAICNLLDRCDLSAPHRYPCGAGHAYIVVGPGGELARCHMEMERTVGTVWEEDLLAAVREGNGFHNPPVEEKEGCRECPWRYVCAGGCPLLARRQRGTPAAPSPYCAVYRAVLPELLRLEGMRLLQANCIQWSP